MSDEQANTVIHLRHRLRAMAASGYSNGEAARTLDQLRDIVELVDDPELRSEHSRWCVCFGHSEQRRLRLAV